MDAGLVAERIRADIAQSKIFLDDGTRLDLAISIGVAALEPDEGLSSLLARADEALYAAKEAGRNCVMISERRQEQAVAEAL